MWIISYCNHISICSFLINHQSLYHFIFVFSETPEPSTEHSDLFGWLARCHQSHQQVNTSLNASMSWWSTIIAADDIDYSAGMCDSKVEASVKFKWSDTTFWFFKAASVRTIKIPSSILISTPKEIWCSRSKTVRWPSIQSHNLSSPANAHCCQKMGVSLPAALLKTTSAPTM